MTTLNVRDANTGNLVAIDIDNPTGNLYVRDANTGNLVLLDLASPTGKLNVVDADTGNLVEIDYDNPVAVFNVNDPNTGEIIEIDLSNPTGSLYCLDANTGDFVLVDLSTASFISLHGFALPLVAADTTAPTVTITSTETSPSAANPIPLAFELSEVSTDFTINSITFDAGFTKSNFAGSGTSYTCDAIVTTAGATLTVNVAAGAFHDAAGNGNTAATQFSITSGLRIFDQFTTNEAAPIVTPRTCEPGPGVLKITDAGSVVSIASNVLTVGVDTVDRVRGGEGSAAINHAAGLGIMVTVPSANTRADVGWGASGQDTARGDIEARTTTLDIREPKSGVGQSLSNVYDTVTFPAKFGIIRSQTGMNYYIMNSRLVWVSDADNKQTLSAVPWVCITAIKTWIGTFDNLKVASFGAPWTTDYGIATSATASPSTGATGTMEANGIPEFTWTAGTGETLDFMVRRTDDNNCWIVRLIQATGRMYLFEKQGGVETERGAVGGVAITLTNGTKYRIVAHCDGTRIRVWAAAIASSLGIYKITYASASFNQSATGIKVSGFATGSNLVAYPIDLSGAALSEVQRVYPF